MDHSTALLVRFVQDCYRQPDKVQAAIVCGENPDGTVNVAIFDRYGKTGRNRMNVLRIDEGEELPSSGSCVIVPPDLTARVEALEKETGRGVRKKQQPKPKAKAPSSRGRSAGSKAGERKPRKSPGRKGTKKVGGRQAGGRSKIRRAAAA